MTAVGDRLAEAARLVVAIFANGRLRRVESARAIVGFGGHLASIVFIVAAYRGGGAAAVAALFVAKSLSLVVAAPLGALIADRYRRNRVMAAADSARALVLVGAAATSASDVPVAVLIRLAVAGGVVGTASAPARAALIPQVARTPEELTAANVVASMSENVAGFGGPAAGGLVVALFDPSAGFAVAAVASACSAVLVAGIDGAARDSEDAQRPTGEGRWTQAVAGFRVIARDPVARVILAVYSAQTLVGGAVGVILVAAAAELLGMGASGVGYLYSAIGVGGLAGAAVALGLGNRLGPAMAVGVLIWSIPMALVGVWPGPLLALALFALSGAGDAVVDVSGLTLAQRRIPDDVRGRVGGASSLVLLASATVGNVVGPVLMELVGIRGALIAASAAIPVAAVVWWRPVSRLDLAAPPALAALRSQPLFAALALPTLEELARSAERLHVPAGSPLFRQGEPGDRFYVVLDGAVEISVDDRVVTTARHGESFGEIALLTGRPRTASATATTDAHLYAFERARFVRAVTGAATSLAIAEELVEQRLARAVPLAPG